MDELLDLDVSELTPLLQRGEVSPVELAKAALDRIDRLDPAVNAFVSTTPERALAEAAAAEQELKAGQSRGPLHGVPYAAKDLLDVNGLATGAGSSLLTDNIATSDCTVVRRMTEAGMVLVGKTQTVQFAFGGAGVNHDTGTPHNPWRPDVPHVCGGSSSGSAAAVAARMVPVAIGTDTSGSVRIPSSLCGVTGLKTTVGRVSRAGVYPLSPTLDSVGPLTRSAADCALVYQAIQGADAADASTLGQTPHDVLSSIDGGVDGLKLAVIDSFFFDDADPEVEAAVRATVGIFESLGAEVSHIEAPELHEVMGSAEHPGRARTVAAEGYVVNREMLENSFSELDPIVSNRMLTGLDLLAVDFLEAFEAWTRMRGSFEERAEGIDAYLVPSTMYPALPVSVVDETPEIYAKLNGAYLRNTSIGNRFEWSGLSVPCGFTNAGLPIGLSIHAPRFQEDVVLRIGKAFQQATHWHRQAPPA